MSAPPEIIENGTSFEAGLHVKQAAQLPVVFDHELVARRINHAEAFQIASRLRTFSRTEEVRDGDRREAGDHRDHHHHFHKG